MESEKDCAKTQTRRTTMPFYCRKFRGHEGSCSPYALAPSTCWTALNYAAGQFQFIPIPSKEADE